VAGELVALPLGVSGGVVAHLLARAAASLRVDEGRALAALGPEPGSRASQLAVAEALVAAGA
jgi:hypothetical protein